MPNRKPITHAGESLTLTEWAKKTGIPATTIKARVEVLKWDFGRAISEPPNKKFGRGGRRPKDAPRPVPALKEHATGQAVARWSENGKDCSRYFGVYGTPEAAENYRRFVAEWAAGAGVRPTGDVDVGDVIVAWLAHCRETYTKRGKVTSEYHCNRAAMKPLNDLYGDTSAAEFDAPRLRTVRKGMTEKWARKTVNDHVARIVRMFSWAVTENLAPAAVADQLARVGAIAKGRDYPQPEPEPKEPVPPEHIAAVLPHLHPKERRRKIYEAMVRVQVLTGVRPGELVTLRPKDINTRRVPWRYEVTEYNKMIHRDVIRVVFFGPEARDLLAPLLEHADPEERLFRLPPWRKKATCSPISVVRYRNRIRLACLAAGVPVWTPHRLRHNRATDVMERYEDDRAVAAAIGDSPEVARQVYAHRPGEAVAARIAEATG